MNRSIIEAEIASLNASVEEYRRELERTRDRLALARLGKAGHTPASARRLERELSTDFATVETYEAMRDALAALLKVTK